MKYLLIIAFIFAGCNSEHKKETQAQQVLGDSTTTLEDSGMFIGDWTLETVTDSNRYFITQHPDSSFTIEGDTMKVIRMMWDEYFKNIHWKSKYDSLVNRGK
jgi:hypothetical protein